MIIFWLALVPIYRILRAAIPVSFDDIKELIQYISRKHINNSVLYQDHDLTLVFIYLAHHDKKTEISAPNAHVSAQKLAPSLT